VSYEFRSAHEAAMAVPRHGRRGTQRLLYRSHECQCRAVLLQLRRLLVNENVIKAMQSSVQVRLCGGGCQERLKVMIPANAKVLLNAYQPRDINVQHTI
jgi:hypothetical protein